VQIAGKDCDLHGSIAPAGPLALAGPRGSGTHHAAARRMDFMALLIVLGFFAACWGFVALCERLSG